MSKYPTTVLRYFTVIFLGLNSRGTKESQQVYCNIFEKIFMLQMLEWVRAQDTFSILHMQKRYRPGIERSILITIQQKVKKRFIHFTSRFSVLCDYRLLQDYTSYEVLYLGTLWVCAPQWDISVVRLCFQNNTLYRIVK